MSLPHYCPKWVHCSFSLLPCATPSHCHLSGRMWRWSSKQLSCKPTSFPYLLQCFITLSPVMFSKCKSEFAWLLDPHPNAFLVQLQGSRDVAYMLPVSSHAILSLTVYILESQYSPPFHLSPASLPMSRSPSTLIPGIARTSLVAQMVEHLSAMQKTRVWSREDSLEKEMATHSSILAWEIPWTEEPDGLWGHKESDTTEQLTTHLLSKAKTNPVLVYRNSPLYLHNHWGLWILFLTYHWKLTKVHSILQLLTLPDVLDNWFWRKPLLTHTNPHYKEIPGAGEKATISDMFQTNHVSKQLCFKQCISCSRLWMLHLIITKLDQGA